jgi:hypothetical protein
VILAITFSAGCDCKTLYGEEGCKKPADNGGGGGAGSGGTGGSSASAPTLSATDTPSTIYLSTLVDGITAAYSSGGGAAAANYVLTTVHVNDIIIDCGSGDAECTSLSLLDVDLYDFVGKQWIVGDGNPKGVCQGTVCRSKTSTRYIYVNGGRALDFQLSYLPPNA